MRCLYCGNEVALLKKFRGGGEFCSESHRQKYQEEYTQLALSRLMQAHPNAEKRAAERAPRRPQPPPQAVQPEPAKPAVAPMEPCGFLVQRFEPRQYETEPFSHGPVALETVSALPSQGREEVIAKTLPHASAFRTIAFSLVHNAPPSPAAPESIDFRFLPEFEQAADRCLRLLTSDDLAAATAEAPARAPIRRPTDLRQVMLRLAPPPNSGPQNTCRPVPFPVSRPDLPPVNLSPIRTRFSFAPAPAPARARENAPAEFAVAPRSLLSLDTADADTGNATGRSRITLVLSLAGAVVLVAVAAVFLFTRGSENSASVRPQAHATPNLIAETDWTTEWSGRPPGTQFSMLRPSLMMSDYRIEFQGQILSKSLGWIFRATDPKNYYALKLEITKPGAMAEVSLIRTVLDNGQHKDRSRIPLRQKVARDTVFKIRTDVVGQTFQTWIQGDLMDTWSDSRYKIGGFGLLTDAAGRAKLRMIQLTELQDRAHTR